MTDKKYRRFKKRIVPIFEHWLKVMGLNDTWHVTLHLDRGGFNDGAWAMECTPNWQYLNAEIHVNVPVCIDDPDEELEKYLVHELFHIVLAGENDHPSPEMHEHTTSQLTNVIVRLKREFKTESSSGA